MNTIPFSEIRERFTDIAQKVQFQKQIFITKKNNKPAIGLVPVEYLQLLSDIFDKANESEDIAEVIKKYILLIEPAEFDKIRTAIKSPPKPNKRMLASARAAFRKTNS